MNNREIAIAMWLVVFFILLIINKKIQIPIYKLLKEAVSKSLILAFCIMMVYVILIVYVLYKLGMWDVSLLKDTAIWIIGSGAIMIVNSLKVYEGKPYLKNMLIPLTPVGVSVYL